VRRNPLTPRLRLPILPAAQLNVGANRSPSGSRSKRARATKQASHCQRPHHLHGASPLGHSLTAACPSLALGLIHAIVPRSRITAKNRVIANGVQSRTADGSLHGSEFCATLYAKARAALLRGRTSCHDISELVRAVRSCSRWSTPCRSQPEDERHVPLPRQL